MATAKTTTTEPTELEQITAAAGLDDQPVDAPVDHGPVTGPAVQAPVMESITGGWRIAFEVPTDRIGPVAYVALADLGAVEDQAVAVTWLGEAAARLGVYVDSFTEGALVLAVAEAPYEPTTVTVMVKL